MIEVECTLDSCNCHTAVSSGKAGIVVVARAHNALKPGGIALDCYSMKRTSLFGLDCKDIPMVDLLLSLVKLDLHCSCFQLSLAF